MLVWVSAAWGALSALAALPPLPGPSGPAADTLDNGLWEKVSTVAVCRARFWDYT